MLKRGPLDPMLAPEYLREDVGRANAAYARFREITELVAELATDPEIPLDQFARLIGQQCLAWEAFEKRSAEITAHLNIGSDIIRERLGLDDYQG